PVTLPPAGHPRTKPSITPVTAADRRVSRLSVVSLDPPATAETVLSTYSLVVASLFFDGARPRKIRFTWKELLALRSTIVLLVPDEVALSSFALSAFDRRPLTDWVATGLSASAVLLTFESPTSAFVRVTLPVCPLTDWTSEVVTISIQFSSLFAGSSASTNVFPRSVRMTMLPATAGRLSIADSESTT